MIFMNKQARKLYNQAQANYPALKAQIEAQVVRWFWAAGGIIPDKGLKEKPVLESSISNKKNTYKDK